MALNYDDLMATSVVDLPNTATATCTTMLYAAQRRDGARRRSMPRELPYVLRARLEPLRTMPSMATVLVPDMFPPDLGWDFSQVLHVEQRLELYRPLPPAAATF